MCLSILGFLLPSCGPSKSFPVARVGTKSMVSRASGKYFEVYDGTWKGQLVKGVNIGASMPGRWFGEHAVSKDMYARWLKDIADMNANTILVYTLLKPGFYEALDDHNRAHPDKRLWLIQQVWPRDEGVINDLYVKSFVDEYKKEISLDADALAGKANIGERRGEAWGKYTRNVMPYVLGIVIGREITNLEVKETNSSNPGKTSHLGRFVRTGPEASPIEVWCAEMADTLAAHVSVHKWAVPVGYVSWPTLDPLDHPTERTRGVPKPREVDDSQVLDPRHMGAGPDAPAGFFGVFQIYTYYPEFMYRQPSYAQYTDQQGVLRYGGYLQDFMRVLPSYPALVGEFGLPTSVSSSHYQPEGLSQGNIEEADQGKELSRLYGAIVREGYAGGLVFEWADEWAKSNWVTAPYMVPFDRHVLWHNATDPEQCFGIATYESGGEPSGHLKTIWSDPSPQGKSGDIRAVSVYSDVAFCYLGFEIKDALSLIPGAGGKISLAVGVSTLGKGHGTTRLPVSGLAPLPVGAEFLLTIGGDQASLLNRPDYSRARSRFSAASSHDPTFEPVVYITNREQVAEDGTVYPPITTNQSILRYGDFERGSSQYNSLGNWYVDGSKEMVVVRLPWGLLNVTDPSSNRVILDTSDDLPPGPAGMRMLQRDTLDTVRTPGFSFFAATSIEGDLADFGPREQGARSFQAIEPFNWRGWETPSYVERLKDSYAFLRETYGLFKTVPAPAPAP